MISLSKITISNFKVFGAEPYTLNFNGDRLVLLDGPNGYGKTSVFDAIELGITGNISRLISLEARQNPADVVVAHQGNENVEVILEFVDSESNVKVFQRKMKGRVPDSHKKISKFKELWELNEIVDGRAEPSSQDKLNQYFGSTDLARDFLLFHYVQQEETSRFLKTKNETQRAEELAQLFGNTRESDEKLKKLIDISRNINNTKRKISSRILEIKQLYKIDDFNNIKTEANQPHVYALPWLAETNMRV